MQPESVHNVDTFDTPDIGATGLDATGMDQASMDRASMRSAPSTPSPLPDRVSRIDYLETLVSQERVESARARVAEADARLELARKKLAGAEQEHLLRVRALSVKYRMTEDETVLEDGTIVRK